MNDKQTFTLVQWALEEAVKMAELDLAFAPDNDVEARRKVQKLERAQVVFDVYVEFMGKKDASGKTSKLLSL